MSLKVQSSFSAGELDPALHERTNLEKYNSGLATARNTVIGKTGRLVSRPGRRFFKKAKLPDSRIILHTISKWGMLLEWGHLYCRLWRINPGLTETELVGDYTHDFTEDDLDFIQFINYSFDTVIILRSGKTLKLLKLDQSVATGFFTLFDPFIFLQSSGPVYVSNTVGGTDYDLDYAVSIVNTNQETGYTITQTGKMVIASGTKNVLVFNLGIKIVGLDYIKEMKVYRRPRDGGAFGYIGSSTAFSEVVIGPTTFIYGTFIDWGQAADYGHTPPTLNQAIRDLNFTTPKDLKSQTGCMYQQRLLLTYQDQVVASRTGIPTNFYREYPLSSDSSLAFKMGTESNVNIIRLINNDGLVAFTYDGVYLHTGALSTTNLAMEKRGPWVIDPLVPPVAIPGGVLFIDSLTNTVRQLLWSQEAGTYIAEEVSIFSNHLFENVKVKSWAFQDGNFPLLWVIFSDGTYASFTYEREHKMRAWTRHDSGYGLEYVATTVKAAYFYNSTNIYEKDGEIFFVTSVDGQRYIEIGIPRYPTAEELIDNPQADMGQPIAAMDSIATWQYVVNENRFSSGTTQTIITLSPVTPNVWDGPLTLVSDSTDIFDAGTPNDDGISFPVGTVFRWFNPDDGTSIDLEIDSITDDETVVVIPSDEFPSEYANDVKLYLTTNVASVLVNHWKSVLGIGLPSKYTDPGSGQIFTVAPNTPDGWGGVLAIDSGTKSFFKAANGIYVGQFIYYLTDGGEWIEMQILTIPDDKHVTVQPNKVFPSGEASDPTLYMRLRFSCELDHLEGEDVAVIVDGYVISSPLNDVEDYPTCTVNNSQLQLPNSMRGAIIHIGRPYTMDIETLDIDTVEQHPTLIESLTVNKVYIKVHQSRGFYVGNTLPDNDSVVGMINAEGISVDYEDANPIVSNRYPRPRSERLEVSIPGDWRSQGRICIRQPDPVHFEILSIIPDLEELVRSRL